jgi:hypothetical protein
MVVKVKPVHHFKQPITLNSVSWKPWPAAGDIVDCRFPEGKSKDTKFGLVNRHRCDGSG